jgi:NADH-quinone oxidoreductase subunit N
MTAPDLLVLLPAIITGYGAVVVLLAGAYWRNHSGVALLSLAVLAGAFLSIFAALPLAPRQVTPLLHVDAFALCYMGLFLLGAFGIAIFSHDYLRWARAGSEKYYGLLLLATLGMLVLAASSHFVSFFLALETLSVSLYALIGYALRRPTSLEASLKYLVLAGVALAFLLFGMALIYSQSGTMDFERLGRSLPPAPLGSSGLTALLPLGLGLILVGFGFKLAAVPFHTWAPDVYQGAPAPVSALVATGSKAAMFALLIRFASVAALRERASSLLLLEVLAILTMFGGNLLALLQHNIKRLLAYSSIAHMGYLLIPLLAGGAEAVSSIGFYFASYFIATIGAFGVISVLSAQGSELENLEDYRGLGSRRPGLAAVLGLTMLSLAGIPLTVGFIAKLYIFAAAARAGLWFLLVIGLLNSGLAAYYYLRVLAALYLLPPTAAGEGERAATPSVGWPSVQVGLPAGRVVGSAIGLAVLALLTILFGIYPTPLIAVAQHTSALGLLP